jgi:hypothetical protein
MRYLTRGAAFVLLAVVALPLVGADDKKADDKKADDKKAAPDKKADVKKELDKNVNTEKSIRAGQLTGKVLAIVESKKSLRLQLTLQVPQINQGELQAAADDSVRYQQALLRRDANAAANALYWMQRHQANSVTLQNVNKDVELQTTDDVKVRLNNPPPKYDDKGKIVRYSAKELKELKGTDPKLPGYNGEFSDLAQDQIVTVHLVKRKGDGPRLPPPKVKGKDADPSALLDNLPQVSMIVVVIDPNATQAK